jgi:hypothetical protein
VLLVITLIVYSWEFEIGLALDGVGNYLSSKWWIGF